MNAPSLCFTAAASAHAAADLPNLACANVDPAEVAKFSAMAAQWRDPEGPFKPLLAFNPVRLRYLTEMLRNYGGAKSGDLPLKSLRLLDIGCGGGLISEPMSRLGADVTGIDASAKNIKTASVHAEEQGLSIRYDLTSAETLAAQGEEFDVVLALEVIEHVPDPAAFMATACRLVRPGGALIMSTLNDTLKAYLLAVVAAERLLRWLPVGTHDRRKFIKPHRAAAWCEEAGLEVRNFSGFTYQPILREWRRTDDLSVNYAMTAVKPLSRR